MSEESPIADADIIKISWGAQLPAEGIPEKYQYKQASPSPESLRKAEKKWVAGTPLPRRVRKPFELKPPTAEEKQRRKELREFKDLSTSRREQEAAKRESMEQQAAAAKLQERAAAGLARAKARAEKHAELQAARATRAKDMYQFRQQSRDRPHTPMFQKMERSFKERQQAEESQRGALLQARHEVVRAPLPKGEVRSATSGGSSGSSTRAASPAASPPATAASRPRLTKRTASTAGAAGPIPRSPSQAAPAPRGSSPPRAGSVAAEETAGATPPGTAAAVAGAAAAAAAAPAAAVAGGAADGAAHVLPWPSLDGGAPSEDGAPSTAHAPRSSLFGVLPSPVTAAWLGPVPETEEPPSGAADDGAIDGAEVDAAAGVAADADHADAGELQANVAGSEAAEPEAEGGAGDSVELSDASPVQQSEAAGAERATDGPSAEGLAAAAPAAPAFAAPTRNGSFVDLLAAADEALASSRSLLRSTRSFTTAATPAQEGQDRTSPGASAAAHDDPSAETSEEVAPASQSELSESTIGEPEKVAAADGSEASAAAREEDTGVPDCAGVSSPADVELPQERPDGDEGVLDSAVATDVAPPLLENDAADAAASLEEGPRGPPAAEQTPSSDPDLDPEVSCGSVADDVAEGAPEAAQPAADAEAAGGGGSSTGAAAAGPPQDAADDVRPEGEGSGGEGGGGGTERLGRPGAQDGEVAAGALEGTAIDPFLQVLTAGGADFEADGQQAPDSVALATPVQALSSAPTAVPQQEGAAPGLGEQQALAGDDAEAPAQGPAEAPTEDPVDPEAASLKPAAAEDGAAPKGPGTPARQLQSPGPAPAGAAEGASPAAEGGELLPAAGDSCGDAVSCAEDEAPGSIPGISPSGADDKHVSELVVGPDVPMEAAADGRAVPEMQPAEDVPPSVLPAAAPIAVTEAPPSSGGPAEAMTSGPLLGGAEAAGEVDAAVNESRLEHSELALEATETEAAAEAPAGGSADIYGEVAGGQAAKGEETDGAGDVADEKNPGAA